MLKPAGLFVAAAMAVTAACVSVIATYGLGLGTPESALAGVAAFALMAVAHVAFVRPPGLDQNRLDDLDRVVTELQSKVETLDVRLSTLDAAVTERARAAGRPLVEEIAALGQLVTSIAKEVAAHEAALTRLAAQPPAAPPAPPALEETPPVRADLSRDVARRQATPPEKPQAAPREKPQATPREKPQAPEPFDPLDAAPEPSAAAPVDRGLAARVELALRDDRIDFYLQPVVSLPNRRIVHYEGLSRLREPDGLALPAEFLAAAEAEGHLAEIDRRAIARAAHVAGRLHARGRSVGVFVNVAAATLADERAFLELTALLDARPDLARLLVLELSQDAFDTLGPLERETRERLSERGVRFSIDRVTDLRLEPRDLARRGVRFVKIPGAALFAPEAARGLAIHPSDLANLLARHGVDLIATHIEHERETPELLDLDVKAAMGFLFGVPRPVRDEPPAETPTPPEPPRAESPQRRFAPRPFVRRA